MSKDGKSLVEVNTSWRNHFVAAFNILVGVTGSGTTLQRPTAFPWIGKPYFDQTLGKPIFIASIGPIVWVTADGLPA